MAFHRVHVGIVRGETYRAISLPQHFGVVVGPGVASSVYKIVKIRSRQFHSKHQRLRVDLERVVEQVCALDELSRPCRGGRIACSQSTSRA